MDVSNEGADKVKLASRSIAMLMQDQEVESSLHLRAGEGR